MKKPKPTLRKSVRGTRRQNRVIRVYSEGQITEYDYLCRWRKASDGIVLHWGERGAVPSTLVRSAMKYVKQNRRDNRGRGESDLVEIWCIFDVDDHDKLSETISEASNSGIEVVVSNPCFELWLVLHRASQSAYIERQDIQKRAAKLNLTDGKSIDAMAWDVLVKNYELAKQRASELDSKHHDDGSPARSNPSTDVWRLVDRIRAGAQG